MRVLCLCYRCTVRGVRATGQLRTIRTWREHRKADQTMLQQWTGAPPAALVNAVLRSKLMPVGDDSPTLGGDSASNSGADVGFEAGAGSSEAGRGLNRSGSDDLTPQGDAGHEQDQRISPSTSPSNVQSPTNDPVLPDVAGMLLDQPEGDNNGHVGLDLLRGLLLQPDGSLYLPGPRPTLSPEVQLTRLSSLQKTTLTHYRRWLSTKGTEKAYEEHGLTLEEEGVPVDSLHNAKKLSAALSDLQPVVIDMCVNSCIAYVGEYANHDSCSWVRKIDGKDVDCREPRRGDDGLPRRQYFVLPLLGRLRTMFHNVSMSMMLHYRHRRLQKLQAAVAADEWGDFVFSDSADGLMMLKLSSDGGLFTDPRDIAVTISTDGAQLISKKESSTWIITASFINVPPHLRFKRPHQYILAIVPGPESPGDIDSFFHPIAEELAQLGKGSWVWDGAQQEWFLLRAHLVGLYADQPGSSKLSKMTGTQGRFGCRLCLMQACYGHPTPVSSARKKKVTPPSRRKKKRSSTTAVRAPPLRVTSASNPGSSALLVPDPSVSRRPSTNLTATNPATSSAASAVPAVPAKPGKRSAYFPLRTPPSLRSLPPNLARPYQYSTLSLPMRTDDGYRSHIAALDAAPSKTKKKEVGTSTGVAALPLLAYSPGFSHPDFFPLDVFHLFSYNTLAFMWEIFHKKADPGDPVTFTPSLSEDFGERVEAAASDLPGMFGEPPRDPWRFSGSHFKMVEWMSVFHWYIGPFMHSHSMDVGVLDMLLALLDGIGLALSDDGCRRLDIVQIQRDFSQFCTAWERLYIRDEASLIGRARAIIEVGSVRATSQAACERTIGTIKKELRSFKEPYASIVRRIILVEQLHALEYLVNPTFEDPQEEDVSSDLFERSASIRFGKIPSGIVSERAVRSLLSGVGYPSLDHITFHKSLKITRSGSCFKIRSRSALTSKSTRVPCWVACLDPSTPDSNEPSYYDILVFLFHGEDQKMFAIGRRLLVDTGPHSVTNHWSCGEWNSALEIIDATHIQSYVGVFDTGVRTYIFPPKNAMGGYSSWWAKLCRSRRGT
ncbi:hypothetical protein CF326_g4764 [Tilletia indica]|nr:hypothetical protein CF326_g4764 [Tilletia indica]